MRQNTLYCYNFSDSKQQIQYNDNEQKQQHGPNRIATNLISLSDTASDFLYYKRAAIRKFIIFIAN
jgi:hypothetical protein